MTRAELEQLRYLPVEIKAIQSEIENLPFTQDSVKGSMTEFPYIQRTIVVSGPDEVKGNRLRNRLKQKCDELRLQIASMEDWLDGIEDAEIRALLRLRYRNGLSWRQVAQKMGYADESVTRKRHDRFLQMTEKSEQQRVNMVLGKKA